MKDRLRHISRRDAVKGLVVAASLGVTGVSFVDFFEIDSRRKKQVAARFPESYTTPQVTQAKNQVDIFISQVAKQDKSGNNTISVDPQTAQAVRIVTTSTEKDAFNESLKNKDIPVFLKDFIGIIGGFLVAMIANEID